MKQKANEDEIIILGSGLGGLIAGTLLSIKNRSVLLLIEKGFKPYFEKGGYRFIPFSNLSEKNLNFQLIQNVAKRLGLPPFSEIKGRGMDKEKKKRISFQVILPKSRIDLYQDWALFERELRREFPKEIFEIEKFYEEMSQIKNSLKSSKTDAPPYIPPPMRVRSFMKKRFYFEHLHFSREFKKFLQLQLVSYGNFHSDWFPISFLAFYLLNVETDGSFKQIDLEIFKNLILEKFLHSGGRVEEIERVDGIEMGWRRGVNLSLDEGKKRLHSDILILNSPLHHLSPLLGKKRKKISKFERKIQPRYLQVPIFLGVQEKVIPVGMEDLSISLLNIEKSFEKGNLLYIFLSPKGDESMAPEGKRAVTIEGFMPFEKWDHGLFFEFKEGVLSHLKRLIPFLEDNIEFIDWGWALEQVQRWSYTHYIYESPDDFNWGDGVVPARISENLYFTGKENFPYLGLDGEVLSGLKTGEEILKRSH